MVSLGESGLKAPCSPQSVARSTPSVESLCYGRREAHAGTEMAVSEEEDSEEKRKWNPTGTLLGPLGKTDLVHAKVKSVALLFLKNSRACSVPL